MRDWIHIYIRDRWYIPREMLFGGRSMFRGVYIPSIYIFRGRYNPREMYIPRRENIYGTN